MFLCVWWIRQKLTMAKRGQDLGLLRSYLSKGKFIWFKIWVSNIFAPSNLCWCKECSEEIMEVMHCTSKPPAIKNNIYHSQGFLKYDKIIWQNTELMRMVSKHANLKSRNTVGIWTHCSTSVSLVSSVWYSMTLNCTIFWANTGKEPAKSHLLRRPVSS